MTNLRIALLALGLLGVGCAQPVGGAQAPVLMDGAEPSLDDYDVEIHEPLGCSLEARIARLAGEDAEDCGRIALDGDGGAQRWCAASALAAGRPFRLEIELRGIDSEMSELLTSPGEGRVHVTVYDSSPCGGGQCDPAIHTMVCVTPTFDDVGTIACDDHRPLAAPECGG